MIDIQINLMIIDNPVFSWNPLLIFDKFTEESINNLLPLLKRLTYISAVTFGVSR